ncbi:DUF429 domain-containing protein [Geminicoccaceae bacterium 1502E]|nr:DUF429 domain-containing protein [Geminicoccaceae bacterium 1502E]
MTKWAYRATVRGTDLASTATLFTEDGFLSRTLFNANGGLNSNVGRVRPDDEIHLYYSTGGSSSYLGGGVVRPPPDGPADVRAPAIGLAPPALEARLRELGYRSDPLLDRFTGFFMEASRGDGEPETSPSFANQNALWLLEEHHHAPVPTRPVAAVAPPAVAACPPARTPVFGIDWSGARQAGNKIWRATLDPERRHILTVERPWAGMAPAAAVDGVARWIGGLEQGWIGFDSPFGLQRDDIVRLAGSTQRDPRTWGRSLLAAYPEGRGFIEACAAAGIIGRHRRFTDVTCRSPFAPTLLQMIRQTHAMLAVLARLGGEGPRLLPWDAARTHPVNVVEVCPAVLLRTLGLSNHGYKLRPGSAERRAELFDLVLEGLGWQAAPGIRTLAVKDREGDVLDAILGGLAAWRASAADHAAIAAQPMVLEEGWIYA